MDFSVCAQCGVEIESKGIHFRNHVFCSDECCEDYEAEFADKDEPAIDELVDEDLESDDIDEDLGYRHDETEVSLGDDDFNIQPEDF